MERVPGAGAEGLGGLEAVWGCLEVRWRLDFLLDFGVGIYVCIMIYIHPMTTEKATEKWKQQIQSLWPAAKGSLAKVYKPCIRKNCPACVRGDKHPAWILSMSLQGRRQVMYVPLAVVLQMRQAIKNGRKIEQLLCRNAQDIIKQHRQNRKKRSI